MKNPAWRKEIDSSSLGVRLTVGVAAVSALGLGSVSLWLSLRMQHLLIATHKQNIEYIVRRFPHDVEIYSDMVSMATGVQKAIDNLTTNNTLLWIKGSDQTIRAQSTPMKMGGTRGTLLTLRNIPSTPKLQQVNGRYWLLCANPLVVKEVNLGTVYIAQDITGDQTMFLSLIRNLGLASLLTIGVMTVILAWYVRRSLHPLKQLSQLTEKISADRLGEERIHLENAPSEVRELAQTFERMLARLSEAWEHQRQLVSNVSHELRTPLTIVSGYLQSTLRRGDNLTLPQREALEIAASEADRTIQLMQDLLDLARADSGRLYFQLQPLVLNELLEEVIWMATKYNKNSLNFESPASPITIKADAHRFKQILLNLIDNAVKYSDLEAPITIKLDRQEEKAIIQVCDRGIGIPLQQQARIFERFYRVDEARNRSTGGTGLGLSIVKSLVEVMGGNITVYSQPGQGSTFTIIFPAITFTP